MKPIDLPTVFGVTTKKTMTVITQSSTYARVSYANINGLSSNHIVYGTCAISSSNYKPDPSSTIGCFLSLFTVSALDEEASSKHRPRTRHLATKETAGPFRFFHSNRCPTRQDDNIGGKERVPISAICSRSRL